MRYLTIVLLLFILAACDKGEPTVQLPPDPQASYRVTIITNWSAPNFGVPTVNPHFTRLIGMVHSKDSFLWAQLATPGLEFVAEVGSTGRLNNEIDSMIARQKALARFGMNPPLPTGTIDSVFLFTTDHSCFSFASMIAPSPDWFIGVNKIDLLENGQWLAEKTVDLFVHDAGTEDGDVFGYDNPATVPQQNIYVLTPTTAMVLANGNATIPRIGTIKFIRN